MAGRMAERADLLAYLQRRMANAALVAQRSAEVSEWAADRQRQLAVIMDEICHELHLGAAGVEAQLAQGDAV